MTNRGGGILRTLLAPDPRPAILMVALLLITLATELKFRSRDVDSAVSGVIDLQIAFELLVWVLVGSWIAWHLVVRDLGRRSALSGARRLLVPRDTGLRLLLVAGATVAVSSTYAPLVLSVVRAGQWVILVAWALLAAQTLARDSALLTEAWVWFRRLVVGSALATTVLSLAIAPAPLVDSIREAGRYQWFAVHPIQTGNGLGLALVALFAGTVNLPDRLLASHTGRVARIVLLGLFAGLLVLTRARGALGATIAAVLVLCLLPSQRRTRLMTLLTTCAVAALLLAGVGLVALEEVVYRGQTLDQLRAFSGRGEIFAQAWQLFGERPLTGHGYLAGRSLFLDTIRWAPGESHNVFVEILLSFGIVGVVVFGWLLGLLGVRLARGALSRDAPTRLMMREACAYGVFLVASGMVAEGFITPGYEASVLMVTIVCCAVAKRRGGRDTAGQFAPPLTSRPVRGPLAPQTGGRISVRPSPAAARRPSR